MLVILNPAAGRRPRRRIAAILRHLEGLGCRVTLRESRARGDAAAIAGAADAGEFDAVVAAGGDGTINEVMNGLAQSDLPLGLVALGTGNVLASELGLPRDPAALARLLAFAPPRPIWAGLVGDRLFLMMAGAGFDAAVLERLDMRWKQRVGKIAFFRAILDALIRLSAHRIMVECDGTRYEAASLVVAKGHFYAGRFVLAREARLDVPLLHLILFQRGRRRDALRYLLAMLLGAAHRLPDMRILPARSI
ncbi:MAG: diacylglycerol kinase family lipid kinase, partial [Alphaproteobacteria bacterium]|nr:diacylglycerol kinase family lipid kinase [Alphaproteobacteria bacterium]